MKQGSLKRVIVRREVLALAFGAMIGWSWVDANPWLFDIKALTASSCVALRAEQIRALLTQDKDLGLLIMRRLNRVMTERLRATRLQLLDLFGGGRTP